jgi:hypothetical protein
LSYSGIDLLMAFMVGLNFGVFVAFMILRERNRK